jgi:sugar phosphate isomerase/epimerase
MKIGSGLRGVIFISLLISLLFLPGCKPAAKVVAPQANKGVQFGVCTALANSGKLMDFGYNYVEGSVQRDLMPGTPDLEFANKKREFDTCRLPVIACNSFLPGTLKVTGPDARPDSVLRYAEVAFRRAAAARIRIIVFGSGGARRIPDGFDVQEARKQFVSLLKQLGPIARKHGITIAIESLQRSETNLINTFEDALLLAREVNDENIKVLADIFHLMRENEKPGVLERSKNYLVHCHIAEIKDQTAPGVVGDDFRPWFSALKKIGYQGGISIEGSWKIENLQKAIVLMNEQWKSSQ